jgi:lysophospholipid acyltransferase (LPLAT)-like uncharacterized protein
MKIRHPGLIKALGAAVAWLVRLWIGTVRYRYRPLGANLDPNRRGLEGRYIYAFWHENLIMPAYHYGRPDIWVLISQHADGQLIAEACRHLSFKVVSGSATRGGVEAVRRMLRFGDHVHLGITPDGPRGPRRRVKAGLVYLAARTGLPIVPVGFAFHRAWRLRSWDRFALPWPWSAVECVTTDPVVVPEGADKDELEAYQLRVEQALNLATQVAERRAGFRPRKSTGERAVARAA